MLLALGCQETFEERLAEVRALQGSGQFSESVALLRELLAERPDNAESNFLLGNALARSGQPTLAAWPLSKAAASPEYAVSAGLLLASSLLATRNSKEAVEALDRVLAADPDRLEAVELRARAHLASHRGEEALADARRVLAVQPENLAALEVAAAALMALERLDEAEALLLRLDEHVEEAEPAVAARICVARARFYRECGKTDRAEASLRGCLEALRADPNAVRYAVDFFDEVGQPEMATRILRDAVESAPENPGMRAWLAERLRGVGRKDEAEQLLVAATEQFPSPRAWVTLADFYRRGEDAVAARRALERALELAGSVAGPLWFSYADLLVDLGEHDRAEAIAAEFTQPVYAHLIRGRVLFEQGDARAALNAFDAGIRLWPNNPGARYLAGRAAERLGNLSRALSEYREAVRADPRATDAALSLAQLSQALGDHRSAFEFAARYTRSHPGALDGYVMVARAATALGAYGAARNAVARLERLEGAGVLALVERAAVEREASGPQAAVRVVEESGLDLADAANEAALRSLLEDLVTQERYEEALARVDELLGRRPEAAYLHEIRGRTLQRAGRPADEVRREFERALEIDEHHAPALAGLANLAWRDGDVSRAVSLLDRAAKAEPSEPAHAYAAVQMLEATGATAEAEARLGRLLERHPLHAGACNDQAWLLAEKGEELDYALELASRASRLQPSSHTYDTLGWVHFKRDEFKEAADALARALALESERHAPSIRYRLGLALAAKGETEGALLAFQEALNAGPFAEAENARAEVARLSRRAEMAIKQ